MELTAEERRELSGLQLSAVCLKLLWSSEGVTAGSGCFGRTIEFTDVAVNS